MPATCRRTRCQSSARHSRATSPPACSTIQQFAGGGGQHRVEILQLLFIDRGERDADVAVAIGDHAYAALFEQVLSRAMPMVAS